ncbi:hypothetical protein [Vibrio mediterranei]|uniref:hypothetical protein n=1 Tax=Vibrio mediterranei TaxID=689 RepID=UPI004068DFC7
MILTLTNAHRLVTAIDETVKSLIGQQERYYSHRPKPVNHVHQSEDDARTAARAKLANKLRSVDTLLEVKFEIRKLIDAKNHEFKINDLLAENAKLKLKIQTRKNLLSAYSAPLVEPTNMLFSEGLTEEDIVMEQAELQQLQRASQTIDDKRAGINASQTITIMPALVDTLKTHNLVD